MKAKEKQSIHYKEIEEWKKILQRYENMLANETDEEKRAEILSDMEKAKKALRDLSSK